jgi:hypothetical protein
VQVPPAAQDRRDARSRDVTFEGPRPCSLQHPFQRRIRELGGPSPFGRFRIRSMSGGVRICMSMIWQEKPGAKRSMVARTVVAKLSRSCSQVPLRSA